LFHFLLNESLVNLPHREIAEITNVAHGNTAYILNGLKEKGFLLKLKQNEFILNNKKGLLEKWIVAYKEALQPALKKGRFRFADENRVTNRGEVELDEFSENDFQPEAGARLAGRDIGRIPGVNGVTN